MQLMKWPDSKIYFERFRLLVILLSILLIIDQSLFWHWDVDGDFRTVSVFSWLPKYFFESLVHYYIVSGLFLVSAIIWLLRIKPKVFSILSCMLFSLSTSMYLQNLTFGDHRQAPFFWLLALLTAKEFNALERTFFPLAGLAICSTYFLAGWEKIILSGFTWVNGTTLQVFVHRLGRENSLLRPLILTNSSLAAFFQAGILLLECSILGVFLNKPIRWCFLIAFLAFHIGIEEIFFYRFLPNYLVVAYLFAVPDFMRSRDAAKD
jgi:hypothetical protein